MSKRLVKTSDKKLLGVASGLAEHFDVDPTFVRVGFVALFFICVVAGLVGYVALFLLIPSPVALNTLNPRATIDNPDQDVR